MSHFVMAVITKEHPTEEHLSEILAPWHEFECTGIIDQYVQNIDKLEDVKAEYENDTTTVLVDPEGNHHDPYDEKYQVFENPEDRTKYEYIYPEGWKKEEVPTSTKQSLAQYIEDYYSWPMVEKEGEPDLNGKHKYGYFRVDENGNVVEAVDRTNPNAKWDWWQIGGRYSGRLRNKEMPGVHLDSARVGSMDWEGMRLARVKEYEAYFDGALKRTNDWRENAEDGPMPPLTKQEAKELWAASAKEWDTVLKQWETAMEGLEKKVNFYDWIRTELPTDNPVRKAEDAMILRTLGSWFGIGIKDNDPDIDGFIQNRPAFTCWGFVKDGEWVESGDMGWFGMSSNSKDPDDWQAEVVRMLENLPEDYWITMVDCHI